MRQSIQKSEIFSETLTSLRMRLKMTQQELAERLGVSKNYIYMIEKGRLPGPKFISQVRRLEETISQAIEHPNILKESKAEYENEDPKLKRVLPMDIVPTEILKRIFDAARAAEDWKTLCSVSCELARRTDLNLLAQGKEPLHG